MALLIRELTRVMYHAHMEQHSRMSATLVLDIKNYRTIPMLIQYFRGSYGRVEMGPMMACIMLTVLPIIILYLACQKYIIEGVVAGAVKG